MMIQFNLLPDVKKEYIKAKRIKRLIIMSAIISSSVMVGIVLVFVSIVQIGQKRHIDDLTYDIRDEAAKIASIKDINKMLTVQRQLSVLPDLHAQKTETSRLFNYLSQLIPREASVSNLSLDMNIAEFTITGQADSIATINKLIDTLKFAEYRVDDSTQGTKSFTIVSSRLSGDNKTASYQVNMKFDPTIFDNTKKITMVINQSDAIETTTHQEVTQ